MLILRDTLKEMLRAFSIIMIRERDEILKLEKDDASDKIDEYINQLLGEYLK